MKRGWLVAWAVVLALAFANLGVAVVNGEWFNYFAFAGGVLAVALVAPWIWRDQ